jgi:hypothetical protein
MTKEEAINLFQKLIQHHERSNANLLARCGDGVRPGWVSADMSMNSHRIKYYRKELAKLETEDNA